MNALIGCNMIIKNKNQIPWKAAIERLEFKKRSCTTFIPKETNKKCCVCNYTHSKSDVPHENEVWNRKIHTKQEVTNCYGILPQSTSPYLRCDVETDLEQLCFVLLGVWDMTIPGLIMRMIGDIDTTPNIKIEKELLQSISDAAVASDAWIITNGYKEESISELVGEVMYNCRMNNSHINFSAIAVGKWGNIHNRHKIEERNHSTPFTMQKGHGRYKQELNHTEYVFFDDGTCDSLDTGEFASNFARQISRGARRRIPLITILIGGTPHSLSSIYTDLKRLVPVVVVNGCGPLADILYKYLKLTEGSYKLPKSDDHGGTFNESEDDLDIATINETFAVGDDDDKETEASSTKKTLKEMLRLLGKFRPDFVKDVRNLYNVVRQQNYETQGKRLPVGELLSLEEEKALGKYLYQMASCLNAPFRDNIHIFNIDSSKPLKETIYYAFVKARDNLSQTKKKFHKTIDEQLHLALRWSIGDTTENQSATTKKLWNDTNKIKQNRLLLIDALSKNMLMFVMNFMKLDIDFAVLFRSNDTQSTEAATHWSDKYHYLQELYSDTKRRNNDPLYLLDKISSDFTFTEQNHLVIVLEKLVGDFMRPLYDSQPKRDDDKKNTDDSTENTDDDTENTDDDIDNTDDDKENADAEHIYRDLFLWCILTYRLDMAKIFLSQLKTRICSALIASKILKSLATYAPDQVAKDTLFAKANEFETHAIEFVRCAYIYDKHEACELIMRRTNLYGGVTCLQMAVAADNKRFIHEDACQALLTNIWYDKVDPVQEQQSLVINILTFGISQFFISIYLKYFSDYASVKPESHVIKHERPKRDYYMLFAFFPLSKEHPNIHWTEILTIITVTTMLFEEIRQLLSQDNQSLIGKIRSYFDLNNRISNLFLVLPAYLLFYLGLALRFTQKDTQSFLSARIVMALDLELSFIRSVLFIGIASHLGPKIVMIRKMTNDLILFIIVIVIFIFGYGVSSRSMTAYGSIDFKGRNIFRDIVYPVYYFVHGSFDNERTQLEATPDSGTTIVTQIIFAFHMLFVNILLINLLIALFSFTINDIQTQARYIWAYDRCDIIRTYHARPALFPPFTFLISIMQCFQWCWRILHRIRNANKMPYEEQSQCFKMIPINDDVDHAWSEFERYSTNGYIRQLLDDQATVLIKGTTTDITSESSSNNADELKRIKILVLDIQKDLEDSKIENNDKLESMKSTITDLQTRFVQMETRCDRWIMDMKEITASMNWIMMATANAQMGESEPPLITDKSRTSSISQKQSSDIIYNRSNQQLNKEYTTAGQPLLQQEQSATPEVRIEMALRKNNNNVV
ncbi:unnamed protein product [Adineta steineri]|uniref:Uncharacterized protein n=1 Tax=Adineta steineri TaxID=433720 RepID=A0A815RIA3_9BILA|nr:unnamed protein product [Adineta steineri]CAF1477162.1 unnamed protein product [Adineta steineri]